MKQNPNNLEEELDESTSAFISWLVDVSMKYLDRLVDESSMHSSSPPHIADEDNSVFKSI